MSQTIGHILYDDTCGFCRSWIPKLGPVVRKQGIEVTPLQNPTVKDRLTVPMADLLNCLLYTSDPPTEPALSRTVSATPITPSHTTSS
mgnify:CR=1 FL=1